MPRRGSWLIINTLEELTVTTISVPIIPYKDLVTGSGLILFGLSFLVNQGLAGSAQNVNSNLAQAEQKKEEMVVPSARSTSIKTVSGNTMKM
ncbi:hypothetical protein PoB_006542500 [Plakobranchus ocellatus]|uniref:Uncharacterized protein n=1 Tax=Plakobranchus ocellatus TaxID=259542 RepID=A0AAV4D451_9GAST|nr:hypothetical protein PoB_006542500 [Plakobranchus ocellatus]